MLFLKRGSTGGVRGHAFAKFCESEWNPILLLSTYKCRVGSARLDDIASLALKTGKMERGNLNKDHRRHSKGGSDPLDLRLELPTKYQILRERRPPSGSSPGKDGKGSFHGDICYRAHTSRIDFRWVFRLRMNDSCCSTNPWSLV